MHQNKIRGFINQAWLRLVLQRVLDGLTAGLIGAGAVWMVLLVLTKTGWLDVGAMTQFALGALLLPVLGLAWAMTQRIDKREVAMKLDEVNKLHARLTTAFCFMEIPEAERTDFQKAAIAEAAGHLEDVRVAAATPLRLPTDSLALVMMAVVLTGIILVKPPVIHGTMPAEEPLPAPEAVLDDLEIERAKDQWEKAREDLQKSEDPVAQSYIEEMDELMDALDKRELSKEEFLHEVDRLERKFFEQRDDEWRTVMDELEKVQDELADNKHTKDLADALKEGDMEKAAKEMEKLAEKLEKGEIKDRDLEKLAKKLEKFADRLASEENKLNEFVEKKEKELAALEEKLKDKADQLSTEQKRKLSRLRRELKKGRGARDKMRSSQRGRTMKKLGRASKEGADRLRELKRRGKGATKDPNARNDAQQKFGKAMDMAANELRDVDKKAQHGRAMDKAQRQAGDMREAVRRNNGANRSAKRDSQQSFDQQAGGQKPGAQQGQPQSGDPQGQPPEGAQPGQPQAGAQPGQPQDGAQQGQPGAQQGQPQAGAQPGQKPGEGQQSAKAGQQPGGAQQGDKPSGGTPGSGAPGQKGAGDSKKGGQTSAKVDGADGGGGRAAGSGGDPMGEATSLDGAKFKKTTVQGRRGEGATDSEIIESAATSGFANTRYREVHTEYENLAEEVMEKDQIPPGYRYYVQKYFYLIRPRDTADE